MSLWPVPIFIAAGAIVYALDRLYERRTRGTRPGWPASQRPYDWDEQ